jgi:hypothetical protein
MVEPAAVPGVKKMAGILFCSATLRIGTLSDARRIERCRGSIEQVGDRRGILDAACRVVCGTCRNSFLS